MINLGMALLAAILNYIIWIFHKLDSKRYFSLHCFVMCVVLIYYAMSPLFKVLHPSVYFWLLLVFTIGFFIILLIKQDRITKALVNPLEIRFKLFLNIFLIILIFVGGLMGAYISAFEASPFLAVGILFYLIGIMIMLVVPAFLTTPERAKKLEKMQR